MKERKLQLQNSRILFVGLLLTILALLASRPVLGFVASASDAAVDSPADASAVNANPTITNPGNQVTTAGERVSLFIQASDPDVADTLTFSKVGNWPGNLNIEPSTGKIFGNTWSVTGPVDVTVKVEDGTGGEATTTFQWTVKHRTVVGNDAAIQNGQGVDSSIKNMVINLSDGFTNHGNSAITVYITQFEYRAIVANVPLTPFVVKVAADKEPTDGEFTVVAVGSTQSGHPANSNNFVDFVNGGVKTVSLAPGETLLPGFLDANANGNNATNGAGDGGTVARTTTGDLIWYSYSTTNENQGFNVAEGQPPSPVVYGNLDPIILTVPRTYAFNITFGTDSAPVGPPATPTPEPTPVADYQIKNGSFENDSSGNDKVSLSDWEVIEFGEKGVDVITNKSSEGDQALDLNSSAISQTVNSLVPGTNYILMLDYQGNSGQGIGTTADASIYINGVAAGMGLYKTGENSLKGIATNEKNDWIVCNGFEFVPDTETVTFIIESDEEDNESNGLLIDNIRIVEGTFPAPPVHVYDSLAIEPGGWHALANGGFEAYDPVADRSAINDENTGEDRNPHLCGGIVDGWQITRESIDLIENLSPPGSAQDDLWSLDVGGQGPGGIAQTITGLDANSPYIMRVYASRHIDYKEAGPMTSEVWVNGEFAHEVVRVSPFPETLDPDPAYTFSLELIEMMSNDQGEITFEIFSTTPGKSGNIVYDNFSLIARSELPDLTPPGDQMGNVGELGFLEIIAGNNVSNTLTFSATGLPDGLDIDAATGVISGTLQTAGQYTVTVTLTGGDLPAETTFNWFVNTTPVVADIADQVNAEGDEINLAVTATDADNDVLEFSAVNLPAGLEMIADTGNITGTVTGIGLYTVTVTVDDSNGGVVETIFTMDVNDNPEIDAIEDQANNINDMVSLQIAVSDEYKTDFAFGSNNLPDGLTLDPATGLISGTVTAAGTYSVDVSVDDGADGTDELSFVWLVNTPPAATNPAAQTGMVGDIINLPVTATDADGDDLTFSAEGLPAGLSIDPSTGVISGELEAGGQSTSTITITDGNGGMTTVTIEWDIEAVTPPVDESVTIFLPVITR